MLNVNKRLGVVCLVVLGTCFVSRANALGEETPHPASPDAEVAERQARAQSAAKAFILGHYQEALDIYLDLYLKSHGRPEYLRNIGRCQQKLNQYDLAISSLKDYLLRTKHVTADERREVQGFIAEIEAAKASSAQRSSTALEATKAEPASAAVSAARPEPMATPPVAAPVPAPPSAETSGVSAAASPGPNLSVAPSPVSPAAPAVVVAGPSPPPSSSQGMAGLKVAGIVASIAAAALAIGGTAMLLHAHSTYDDAKRAGCPSAGSIDCGSKASSVSSSNTLSQVLYVGAGLAAVAGGTMLILAPGPAGVRQVGLATRVAF